MVIMSVKTTVLLGVAVLVVAVGAIVAVIVHPLAGNKAPITYGSMDGYAVNKADVDRLSQSYYAVTPTEIAQTLLDNHLYGLMAKALNITIAPADVQAGIGATAAEPHPYGEAYLTLAITNNLYKKQLTEKLTPSFAGRFAYFNFNQNIFVDGGSVDENFAKLTQAQQKATVAVDQNYALQLANQIYGKLQDKSITFDQAMQLERTDPHLGVGPLPTLLQSAKFDTATEVATSYGLTTQKQLMSAIRSTPVGSYTKVLTGTIPTAATENSPRTPGFYVIFEVDQVISPDNKYGSFDHMLTDFKKHNNYQGPNL